MFYDNFVLQCERKGVSVTKACEEMGLSNATATRWKKGSTPQNKVLKIVADYFNVTTDELKNGAKKPAPISKDGLSAEDIEFMKVYPTLTDSQRLLLRAVLKELSAK